LFPALFTVMAACSAAAIALLLPGDLAAFSNSLGATATFAANVYFWMTQGYFDAPAEFKPLLHTWSLAVEEQFYIFFPLSLLVLQRHLPRRVTAIVAVACLASFIASAVAVARTPNNVFYLPMFRAWELFIGVLLALGAIPPLRKRWQRESASILGVVLLGCGVHLLSGASVFPGATALLPTLGTALLIHVGTSGPSGLGCILALRPLVFIGLISYPLYLWHWPLIVFTKYTSCVI
jgi:peptidoglycan/LPS O-acetylase OafA/YrhL